MTKHEFKQCFNRTENWKSLFIKPDRMHLPVLDSFRAMSFHWVFVFHILYILRYFISKENHEQFFLSTSHFTWVWRGSLGVDIFFVISGFLITNLLIQEFEKTGSVNIPGFYKRRFLRLMPVYYLALLIILVGWVPEFSFIQDRNAASSWANFLYINNFLPHDKQFMLWSWSLAIEEQFYILFPVFFLFLIRRKSVGISILFGLLVLSTLGRYILVVQIFPDGFSTETTQLLDVQSRYFDSIYDKLHFRIGAIVCGVLAAMIYARKVKPKRTNKWMLRSAEVSLISALVFIALYEPDNDLAAYFIAGFRTSFSVLFTLLFMLYLYAGNGQTFLKGFLESRHWFPLAQLSYSNYIWHPMAIFTFYFVFWWYDKDLTNADVVLGSVLGYLVTMVLSVLSFVFIEKPFMRMRRFL